MKWYQYIVKLVHKKDSLFEFLIFDKKKNCINYIFVVVLFASGVGLIMFAIIFIYFEAIN